MGGLSFYCGELRDVVKNGEFLPGQVTDSPRSERGGTSPVNLKPRYLRMVHWTQRCNPVEHFLKARAVPCGTLEVLNFFKLSRYSL